MNPVQYIAEKEIGTWGVRRWLGNSGTMVQGFGWSWFSELKARRLATVLQRESDFTFTINR